MSQGAIKRRYHHFGRFELFWVAVSYQRYAFLLAFIASGLLGGGVWLSTAGYWYFGVPAALGAVKVGAFSAGVASRLSEKMRVTAVAQRRIDAGRFEPAMVRNFCGDPCFRVMAREVLRRAGLGRRERDALVAQYQAMLDEESGQTLIIDHTRGQVFRVEEGQTILVNSMSTTPVAPVSAASE
jgi:hypothetical protein